MEPPAYIQLIVALWAGGFLAVLGVGTVCMIGTPRDLLPDSAPSDVFWAALLWPPVIVIGLIYFTVWNRD